jgi:PleD family two-component response regulator
LFVALSRSYGEASKNDEPIANAKVLIIDGEYPTRKTLRALLLALGCSRIHEACNGENGLEAIRTLAPDVVLLDWNLAGMGGATLLRKLRAASLPHASVPIIVLIRREERVLDAMRLGVHEFLLKPISSGALKARLLSVLAHSRVAPKQHQQPQSSPRKLAG